MSCEGGEIQRGDRLAAEVSVATRPIEVEPEVEDAGDDKYVDDTARKWDRKANLREKESNGNEEEKGEKGSGGINGNRRVWGKETKEGKGGLRDPKAKDGDEWKERVGEKYVDGFLHVFILNDYCAEDLTRGWHYCCWHIGKGEVNGQTLFERSSILPHYSHTVSPALRVSPSFCQALGHVSSFLFPLQVFELRASFYHDFSCSVRLFGEDAENASTLHSLRVPVSVGCPVVSVGCPSCSLSCEDCPGLPPLYGVASAPQNVQKRNLFLSKIVYLCTQSFCIFQNVCPAWKRPLVHVDDQQVYTPTFLAFHVQVFCPHSPLLSCWD